MLTSYKYTALRTYFTIQPASKCEWGPKIHDVCWTPSCLNQALIKQYLYFIVMPFWKTSIVGIVPNAFDERVQLPFDMAP